MKIRIVILSRGCWLREVVCNCPHCGLIVTALNSSSLFKSNNGHCASRKQHTSTYGVTILVAGCLILDTSALQSSYLCVKRHAAKAKYLTLTLRFTRIIPLSPVTSEMSDISLLLSEMATHSSVYLVSTTTC